MLHNIECELYQVNKLTKMLLKMQLAAWLLILVAELCLSSAVYHDYIVVGAGPSGLQLGYYLERAGRDYVILERGHQAGAWTWLVDVIRCVTVSWFKPWSHLVDLEADLSRPWWSGKVV